MGGGGHNLTLYNGTSVSSGWGGGGYAQLADVRSKLYDLAGGGSGGRWIGNVDVSPGQVISYSIGSGGYSNKIRNHTQFYNNLYGTCTAGASGCVLVEWGLGIE